MAACYVVNLSQNSSTLLRILRDLVPKILLQSPCRQNFGSPQSDGEKNIHSTSFSTCLNLLRQDLIYICKEEESHK